MSFKKDFQKNKIKGLAFRRSRQCGLSLALLSFLREYPQNDGTSPSLLRRNNVLFRFAFDHRWFTLKAALLEKCRKQSCNQKNDYVKMASSDFLFLFPRSFSFLFVCFKFLCLLRSSQAGKGGLGANSLAVLINSLSGFCKELTGGWLLWNVLRRHVT